MHFRSGRHLCARPCGIVFGEVFLKEPVGFGDDVGDRSRPVHQNRNLVEEPIDLCLRIVSGTDEIGRLVDEHVSFVLKLLHLIVDLLQRVRCCEDVLSEIGGIDHDVSDPENSVGGWRNGHWRGRQ